MLAHYRHQHDAPINHRPYMMTGEQPLARSRCSGQTALEVIVITRARTMCRSCTGEWSAPTPMTDPMTSRCVARSTALTYEFASGVAAAAETPNAG
jgi:hypothetical protein